MLFYQGQRLAIEFTEDAVTSQPEAEAHVDEGCAAQMRALLKRLADRQKLRSPDQFRDEGDGIFAVRTRQGLRAYGWFHRSCRGVFVVSHFIFKNRPKLNPNDIDRAKRNRELYEHPAPDQGAHDEHPERMG